MKTMIRILSICLLAVFAAAAVTACGNSADAEPAAADTPTEAAVKSSSVKMSGESFMMTDNLGWGSVYLFAWDADYNAVGDEWPGTLLTDKTTNALDEVQFKCEIPEGAIGVVLSNGKGEQTEDITDFTTYDGYWLDGKQDDKGHYLVYGWSYDGTSEEPEDDDDDDDEPVDMMYYAVNNPLSEGFCEEMNRSDLFTMEMYAEGSNIVWDLTFKNELTETEKAYYLQKFDENPLTDELGDIREVVREEVGRADFGMIVRYRTVDGTIILEQKA